MTNGEDCCKKWSCGSFTGTYYMFSYEANYLGIRFKGPYTTEVQCIMSTAFNIALAVKNQTLRKSDLKRFKDEELLNLIRHITIQEDSLVNPLCGRVKIKLRGGEVYEKDMYPIEEGKEDCLRVH